MRGHFVLIASGHDRVGVVEEMTSVICEHQGNVEASRMARLGGEFAILMMVSAPAEHLDALRQRLEGLEHTVHTRPAEVAEVGAESHLQPCGITAMGADHLGILHQLARFLAARGVNIETLNTEVVAAPMSGAPLFTMTAVVAVPPALSVDGLRQALDRLGDELGVDVAVRG